MARSSSLFKAFRKKGLHVQADITVSYNSLSAFLLTSFALPHTHSQTHCRRNFSTFFTLLQGPTQLADGHDQLLVYTTRAFSFIKWTIVDLESKSWTHFHWQAMHLLGCKSQVLKAYSFLALCKERSHFAGILVGKCVVKSKIAFGFMLHLHFDHLSGHPRSA